MKLKHPDEYLRIRIKNGSGTITYKKIHFNGRGEKTYADEYETGIEDTAQLEKIFSVLDFENFLTVDKRREVFEVRNTFEIALDTVRGLGRFIEIEALKNFGDRNATYKALIAFSKELGLDPKEQDQNGYVLMLLEKKRLIKS